MRLVEPWGPAGLVAMHRGNASVTTLEPTTDPAIWVMRLWLFHADDPLARAQVEDSSLRLWWWARMSDDNPVPDRELLVTHVVARHPQWRRRAQWIPGLRRARITRLLPWWETANRLVSIMDRYPQHVLSQHRHSWATLGRRSKLDLREWGGAAGAL